MKRAAARRQDLAEIDALEAVKRVRPTGSSCG
jgi:hypothetical protein